jgi:hypothetical protein
VILFGCVPQDPSLRLFIYLACIVIPVPLIRNIRLVATVIEDQESILLDFELLHSQHSYLVAFGSVESFQGLCMRKNQFIS